MRTLRTAPGSSEASARWFRGRVAVLAAVLLVVLYVGRLTVPPAFFLLFARSLLQTAPTGARAPA
ncbi:MAG TPA: hypothetical protein VKH36_06280 [Acidimicrobiia bacterium]|nr:hypothetical protein [Acidimicrobiia bacterium]